jgi:hypothetical protein
MEMDIRKVYTVIQIVVSHLFLVHALDIVDFKHEWNLVLPQAFAFSIVLFYSCRIA